MGSKNLKAVVVRGTVAPYVYDRERLRGSVKEHAPVIDKDKEGVAARERRMWQLVRDLGRTPIKNWREGAFKEFADKFVEQMMLGEHYHCRRCRTSCTESKLVGEDRHATYEALGPLGSQCLIDDMEAVTRAAELCNRYGMDSISTGGVISFAMEAYEKGLISKDDIGGIDLKWGNHEAMIQMVQKIGEREGFGAVLGEGVKRAAEHIGGIASEYAIHVKGLEFPAHDPRASNGTALEYVTANRGADHMSAMVSAIFRRTSVPELGISGIGRFDTEGMPATVAKMQHFMCLFDSLVACKFLIGTMAHPYTIHPFLEWLNSVTGWDMDFEEFLKCGERIFNLQRMINVRRGISRKDDTLPPRVLTHKLEEGGTQGNLPPLGAMLGEYYSWRGWSEEGIPTKEKLAELGLEGLY